MSLGEWLFRWRLVVIVGAFALAASLAAGDIGLVLGLRSLASLIDLERVFLLTGPLCLVAFALRLTGEARLGAVVYGQAAAPVVVTGGPFRFSRHPLYIGTWLFFVAATAPYLPPAVLAALAVGFGSALLAIAHHEECALADVHGENWARYARSVPFVLGRARGAVDDDGLAPSARALGAAFLGNLFLLSLGLYRLWAGIAEPPAAVGLLNLTCLVLWMLVVVVRRLRH